MLKIQQKKAYKGMGMEGPIARWYARTTGRNIEQFRTEAREIACRLPSDAAVLEVAPGPGFMAIELAKLGVRRIVGLDISRSFVQIAQENARKARVEVTFREGNASAMPFEPASFDFVYCRAAFKNFSEPVPALNEMYRVLKPGGSAVIHDLRNDASSAEITAAVRQMNLGWLNSLLTRWILRWLRKRAYSEATFRQMARQTPFEKCEIRCNPLGAEVMLLKGATAIEGYSTGDASRAAPSQRR